MSGRKNRRKFEKGVSRQARSTGSKRRTQEKKFKANRNGHGRAIAR